MTYKGICFNCGQMVEESCAHEHLKSCIPSVNAKGTKEVVRIKARSLDKPEYWVVLDVPADLLIDNIREVFENMWFDGLACVYSGFKFKASKIKSNPENPDEYLWTVSWFPVCELEPGDVFILEEGLEHHYPCAISKYDEDDNYDDEDEDEDDFEEKWAENGYYDLPNHPDDFVEDSKLFYRVEFEVLERLQLNEVNDIAVVMRNPMMPVQPCEKCGKPATNVQFYRQHFYLCSDCVDPNECPPMPIMNSPAMGMLDAHGDCDRYHCEGTAPSLPDLTDFFDRYVDQSQDEMLHYGKYMNAAVILYGCLSVDEAIEFIKHYEPDFSFTREKFIHLMMDNCIDYLYEYEGDNQSVIFKGLLDVRKACYEAFKGMLDSRVNIERYYPPKEMIAHYYDAESFTNYLEALAPRFLRTFIEKKNYYKELDIDTKSELYYSLWCEYALEFESIKNVLHWFFGPVEQKLHLPAPIYGQLAKSYNTFIQRCPQWHFNGMCGDDYHKTHPKTELESTAELQSSEKEFFDAFSQSDPEEEFIDYSKVGRNDPCPCGSGKKYKKCHGRF